MDELYSKIKELEEQLDKANNTITEMSIKVFTIIESYFKFQGEDKQKIDDFFFNKGW